MVSISSIRRRIADFKSARETRSLGKQIMREQRRQFPSNLKERTLNFSEQSGRRIKSYTMKKLSKLSARQTPSSQQKYFKTRAKIRRSLSALYPGVVGGGTVSRGRGGGGRGRPRGSYKYAIPGLNRPASVFEYRQWLTQQKQLYKMQIQQQMALSKVAQKYGGQIPPEVQQQMQQQMPRQFQQPRPQFAGQSVMPVQPQPYKEISVLERTPLNLSGNTLQPMKETYEETDLMTGQRRIKLRDGGFL